MRTNPYTGENLPENQYIPRVSTVSSNIANTGIQEDIYAPILDQKRAKAEILKEKLEFGANNSEEVSKSNLGNNVASNATGILDFAASEYSNFQDTAGSTAESQQQAIASTLKGAGLGMAIGGPVGAAVGGVAGAALGIIDLKKDKKIRSEEADMEHRKMLADTKTERKKAYLLSQGEQASARKENINTNYNPYG